MSNRLGMRLLVWVCAMLCSVAALAQTTSSALNGRVTDAAGNPVVGATVEIVHMPSNSAKTEVTDNDGRYTARGLRVGGPFKVTVSKSGLKGTSKEDVFLALAEESTLNLQLESEVKSLDTIQVVAATQSTTFQADNKGLSTNVNRQEIDAFPSIARSLQDYVRLDPRISQTDKVRGEISAVGQNSRFNNITVDAVSTNDEFGLEANGLPSQSGSQPISIDWIQEFNISTANYDVANTRAVGASINAVTKSGTNDFHGSAYYSYRNGDWVGDNRAGAAFSGFDQQHTGGFDIGGPIIKDTLFFFLGYEQFKSANPAPDFGPVGSSATNRPNITQAQLDQLIGIAHDRYGIDIGSLNQLSSANLDDKKYIAKVDWNINSNHRANFRYNRTESEVPVFTDHLNATTLSLSSDWYLKRYDFKNYAMSIYDDWTDNFSSEFSMSYSKYTNRSIPNSVLPFVQVFVDTPNRNSVDFGTELSRQVNSLDVNNRTAFWAGTWNLTDHALKFGFDYKHTSFMNFFLQNYYGNYTFASINDFASGFATTYRLQQPVDGNLGTAAADWAMENWGLFLQDTWQVTYNLSTQFGVRLDMPKTGDSPLFNPGVLTAFGRRNDNTIDGQSLAQPRLSFNYSFDAERPTQLRGGLGLFQGSEPDVWLSNSYSGTGLQVISYQGSSTNHIGFVPDPFHQPTPTGTALQNISLTDSNFQLPSVWRASLAFDRELPWWGLVGTAEYLYLDTNRGVNFQHLNLGAPTGTLPDGRNSYWTTTNPATFNPNSTTAFQRANRNRAFGDVMLLTNTDKGKADALTLSLEKPFANDWHAKVGWTLTDSSEVSPATSSVALSNWNGRQIYNPNEDIASRANYEIQQRLTAAVSWKHYFFDKLASSVSAFYEGRAGRPFSYTFLNDANGDGVSGNDLFYVPLSPDSVIVNGDATGFWNYIQGNHYLDSHRGQVVGRNALRAPFVNNIDLRFSQEVPGFWRDAKGRVDVDIVNFLNLLNKKWGQVDEVPFPGRIGVAQYAGVDPATGRYVYNYTSTPNGLVTYDGSNGISRWAINVTLRYDF